MVLRCFALTGKHSTKKDDFLQTLMLVPLKQHITISKFDPRSQREAFTVSPEGLKQVGSGSHMLRFLHVDTGTLGSGISTPSLQNLRKPEKTGRRGWVDASNYEI